MIQWLHQMSKSWLASLLMGGLALSFIVWGIADVFTGRSEGAMATVGSTQISEQDFSRTYRNFLRNRGQQMGMQLTPDLAQKMGLDRAALDEEISRTALNNVANQMGLTFTDANLAKQVRAMQAFKGPTGEFSHDVFLQIIQNAGYNEQDFLAEMRSDDARNQLTQAIEEGFTLPDGYSRALVQFVTEKRAANYVIVPPSSVGPIAPPSDKVLAKYVKAHAAQFSTPEYRQVQYAVIAPKDVTDQVKVTDKMIANEFNTHETEYNVPEKRNIQQIEFPNKAAAEAARKKIAAGTTFKALAAEQKISPQDLSLGTLAKTDIPDKARADAAFSLPLNQVSQPIKGALNGYVLLRVTKITPAIKRTLDDVKDQIRHKLALELAGAKVTDIVNAFEDANSGGDDLAAAAKKAGMQYFRIAAVDKEGRTPSGAKVPNLPTDPVFLSTVFSTEVGDVTDPFAGKSGANYAIKVDGVTPSKLKPLAQVHDQAVVAWTAEQRAKALAAKAVALAAKAKKDGGLNAIAKELKVSVKHSPALARNTSDATFSSSLISKLFDAAPGGVVQAAQTTGGNYVVARLTGISFPNDAATEQRYQAARGPISAQTATDFTTALAYAARLQQGVQVNQTLFKQATGGSS